MRGGVFLELSMSQPPTQSCLTDSRISYQYYLLTIWLFGSLTEQNGVVQFKDVDNTVEFFFIHATVRNNYSEKR